MPVFETARLELMEIGQVGEHGVDVLEEIPRDGVLAQLQGRAFHLIKIEQICIHLYLVLLHPRRVVFVLYINLASSQIHMLVFAIYVVIPYSDGYSAPRQSCSD
jgi:hypothetical protein